MVQIAMLLALLLCGESVNGTPMERFLMAQTVVYRAHVSGLSVEEVIYAPGQYSGVKFMDRDYQLYRPQELAENVDIALLALLGPTVRVSNFARTGTCMYDRPCAWEVTCEIVAIEGAHTFYLCPEWIRLEESHD